MSHPPIVLPLDRADRSAPGTTPVVVIGTDALLAALPATAVQLAQACRRAGYASAVPLSWGDELVAHACLEELATRSGPAVCAACPRARERLRAAGPALARFAVPLAPPPTAVARYLRRLAGATPLRVTFVGGCPGALDPEIDERIAPADFIAALVARGIAPAEQPTVFDDVLPPDRRRHLSLPGGAPAPDALWAVGGRRLVEIAGPDEVTQIADHLLSGEPVLLDLAPGHGCVCSGATEAVPAGAARIVVAGLEPPRASRSVVEPRGEGRAAPEPVDVPAAAPATHPAPPATPVVPAPRSSQTPALPWQPAATTAPRLRETPPEHPRATPRTAPLTPAGTGGRRSPVGLSRITVERTPLARTEDGRLLPRAYVARRRSLPHGVEAVPDAAPPAGPMVDATAAPAPAPARPAATTPTVPVPAVPPLATSGRATPVSSPVVGSIGPASPPGLAAPAAAGAAGEEWRVRLDEAIAAWRRLGFRTAVLERARGLPHRPDVDGLLAAYASAVERLRALEAAAVERRPELRGAPAFHDPERVGVAQTLVDALVGTARRG